MGKGPCVKGLAQTLVTTGVVDADEISAVVADGADDAELRQRLVAAQLATELQIAEAVATHTGHRFVDLGSVTLDPGVVATVSPTLCRRYHLIPISRGRRQLTVGMVDPTDLIAL